MLSRIGRFHITGELGRGTVGAVYIGHDPVIDRDVAIKIFNPKLTPQERRAHEQQLINEARAAGRLSHPHIVTIFEASSEGPETYIAMEFLRGRELSKLLDEGHKFELDDVASIIWKLSDALHYAHQQNVVHRDIKPANIFLVADHQPKLVDFGIARAPNRIAENLAGAEEPFTLFRNNLLGTPNYMSPEQATGREVDSRTDIYSLGAVMFEMLTGRKPFVSRDTDKLLHLIAYKAPDKPHEVDASIPIALSKIVMKAMSKQPERRYQSADEMTNEIKRYLIDGKRARRRLKMSMPVDEVEDGADQPIYARPSFLIGCIALAGAVAMVAWQVWHF
ncbi:serine/threonine protein kinase [Actimicrobium sp. GrIS 1.19]|uniref:serine/threonine protein kinase n=1 Tax=Actimicrobium sp. GrIS 1.19 TaxID=3071708 RepID=UPI002E096FF2|nr:serine/threonine protein kinase [Actimicrobium sp. GrIS 1.19]